MLKGASGLKLFFLGLFVGLLAGAALVYIGKKNDFYIPSFMKIINKIRPVIISKKIVETDTLNKQVVVNKNIEKKKNTLIVPPSNIDTNKIFQAQDLSDDSVLTHNENNIREVTVNKNDNEDIVIAKDELLFETNLILPVENNNIELIKNELIDNSQNKNVIRVEYWKSPLNFKGYKYFNKKLIVFGMLDYDIIKYKILDNNLYLFLPDNYYIITKTDLFKAFVKLNNPIIITKLNEVPYL